MKKLIIFTFVVLGFQLAQAQKTIKAIADNTHELEIPLDQTKVSCLVGDYIQSSLKIVIDDLKYYTELDHTSFGAAGPCVSAGACTSTKDGLVTDPRLPIFMDPTKPTEKIKLRVVKSEVFDLLPNGYCSHYYQEHVTTTIRGVDFAHLRTLDLSKVSAANCK